MRKMQVKEIISKSTSLITTQGQKQSKAIKLFSQDVPSGTFSSELYSPGSDPPFLHEKETAFSFLHGQTLYDALCRKPHPSNYMRQDQQDKKQSNTSQSLSCSIWNSITAGGWRGAGNKLRPAAWGRSGNFDLQCPASLKSLPARSHKLYLLLIV